MKDEQEVFVSRHGRRTTLGSELDSLNIEDQQPVAATVPEVPKNPKFKPAREFHMPRPQISKKKIAVTSAILLAIILLPLAMLELIGLQYHQGSIALRNDVNRIAKQTALPLQKKAVTAEALNKPLTELRSSVNGACRGGLFDNIASLYPRSKAALDQCNQTKSKASAIVTELAALQNLQRYEEASAAILKPALAASSSPYAVIPDQVVAWQTVAGKMKKLDAPDELKTFHSSLIQVTHDIAAQWSSLNTANNAQDQVAFNEAQTKLGSFYESLRELAPTINGIQQDVQAQLTSAANNN